ncbi:CALX protein, partial [Polypterus senegalus]
MKDSKLSGDKGLVLKSQAKHHAISSKLKKPFVFETRPLIVQYEVNFQNGIDCGGAYVKLLSKTSDLILEQFVDKTPYTIMFGPDKCGEDYKLHFIFRHKNPKTGEFEEKHAKKPDSDLRTFYTDKKTHLYTLDNSFEVLIDQTIVNSGNLLNDMSPAVNPAAEIEDPDDKKPDDWDERAKIQDPDAVKPDDWDEDAPAKIPDESAVKPEGWLDDEPEYVSDPDALKPEDWDEEMDGEWEAPQIANPKCETAPGCGFWERPMIDNPNYKGKWKAPMIDNPNYQGVWKPRKIPNPDYFEDLHPFRMTTFSALGLELWSMSSDIFFDNFIICSDRAVAEQWANDGWGLKRAAEGAAEVGANQALKDVDSLAYNSFIPLTSGSMVSNHIFYCRGDGRICVYRRRNERYNEACTLERDRFGSRARAIPPRNVQELAGALVEEWGNISQRELTNLVQSIRRRCTAVLQAAGGHTRY